MANKGTTRQNIYTNISHSERRALLMFKNLIKTVIVPFIRLNRSGRTFIFRDTAFRYFIHGYNTTWLNERSVEIPVISSFIDGHSSILEVGNVLSHYRKATWDILDKFEEGEGIINADIVDYRPNGQYDLISSISTLEHVGFDDDEKDDGKVVKAISNLKEHCLASGGKMVVTLPIGYNKKMDEDLFSGTLFFNEKYFLKRISKENTWREVRQQEVVDARYGYPFPGANCICVGIITK